MNGKQQTYENTHTHTWKVVVYTNVYIYVLHERRLSAGLMNGRLGQQTYDDDKYWIVDNQ